MNNINIPIVIPAYEPDESLLTLCNNLYSNNLRNIIIVDDGSGDKYKGIFEKAEKEYQCTIIRHAVNLGKGRALKNAFNYILNMNDGSILGCVTADSDGQHTPKDIKKCIDSLKNNRECLILGCRKFNGDDVPFKSKFGNELTRKVCAFLCGINVSDTQTGLRGIPVSFMKTLMGVQGERFEYEMNMLIACKDKVDIVEVPIQTIYDSKEDHKTHFDPLKDSIRIYKIFGKIFLKYIYSSLSSCIVDLLMFSVFCSLFKTYANYIVLSTVLARVISATYNYLINYKLVFSSNQQHKKSSVKYFTLAVVQMTMSALLVTIGVKVLTILPPVVVKIIVDTLLFLVSYFVQRKYIF